MSPPQNTPKIAGYEWLRSRYEIQCPPHYMVSFIGKVRKSEEENGHQIEIYPAKNWLGDEWQKQIEFALKREGINFQILLGTLNQIPVEELVLWILEKPTSRFRRIAWYVAEVFGNRLLPVPDLAGGNYVDLFDPEIYVTCIGENMRRYKLRHNGLGAVDGVYFQPVVRRSAISDQTTERLKRELEDIHASIPAGIFDRATHHLYTKETKSSFEIEREIPERNRADRFVRLLRQVGKFTRAQRSLFPPDHISYLIKFCASFGLEDLSILQRVILDETASDTWRKDQNYVGETVRLGRERIHYISPRPENVNSMMEGLEGCRQRFVRQAFSPNNLAPNLDPNLAPNLDPKLDPIIAAAVLSYAFVFIHPFSDGNGRTHRFFIHEILAAMGFTPEGMILPVSATMLKYSSEYDKSLEAFSEPLMPFVEYTLNEDGVCEVNNDTLDLYRFPDLTEQCKWLAWFLEKAIKEEVLEEVEYIQRYDWVKSKMASLVDMTDQKRDLFIKLTKQNGGQLAKRKREKFPELSPERIETLAEYVYQGFFTEAFRKPDE